MYHLKKFIIFANLADFDSLVSVDSDKMQILVEDHVMYLKKSPITNSFTVPIVATECDTARSAKNLC